MRFVLIEGIKDSYRYFQDKYSEDEFYNIVSLDPTANVEKDKRGKYQDWLLKNVFANDNPAPEEVTKYLKLFTDNVKYMDNKNITQFKDFDELKTFIDSFEAKPTYQQMEADNIKAGKEAKPGKDYKLIYESEHYALFEILTYGGSVKLGKGAHWCTASTTPPSSENMFKGGRDHYWDYTHGGAHLYVIINKSDASDKYQFVDDTETVSFLNKDDAELTQEEWENISRDQDLINYIGDHISERVAYMYSQNEYDVFEEEITDDKIADCLRKQPHTEVITFYDATKLYSYSFDNDSLGLSEIYKSLKEIRFDNEPLEEIPSYCFSDIHMEVLQVPETNLINRYAYYKCSGIELDFQEVENPTISKGAFVECEFNKISFDSSLDIEPGAFVRCNVKSLLTYLIAIKKNYQSLIGLKGEVFYIADPRLTKDTVYDSVSKMEDKDILTGLSLATALFETITLRDGSIVDKDRLKEVLKTKL